MFYYENHLFFISFHILFFYCREYLGKQLEKEQTGNGASGKQSGGTALGAKA